MSRDCSAVRGTFTRFGIDCCPPAVPADVAGDDEDVSVDVDAVDEGDNEKGAYPDVNILPSRSGRRGGMLEASASSEHSSIAKALSWTNGPQGMSHSCSRMKRI